jgi:hypothetical protein
MTDSSSATDWNQDRFDQGDRRRGRDRGAARGEKAHDILHLAAAPEEHEGLHAIVREHCRHTDVLHAHEGALVLTCAQGDGDGLHAKLQQLADSRGLRPSVNHDTFPAGTQLTEAFEALRGR